MSTKCKEVFQQTCTIVPFFSRLFIINTNPDSYIKILSRAAGGGGAIWISKLPMAGWILPDFVCLKAPGWKKWQAFAYQF